MLELFHFLRPEWIALLPLVVAIWWYLRPKKKPSAAIAKGIAPHLAQALLVGADEKHKTFPIDALSLALALLVVAVSGPTWSRVPDPLLAETAPLIVALKVTPSMEEPDVPPSRLQRASFKIQDLVERRSGGQTALFAYAGSAHRVAPLTQDPNIISSFLQGLSAKTMPKEGDRADLALEKSIAELERSDVAGAILFVLDDFDPANLQAFSENASERPPVVFLTATPSSIDVAQVKNVPNSTVVKMTTDDTDINQIERSLRSAYQKALAEDETQKWNDRGWLLAWPSAFLLLLSFRRGWTVQALIVFLLMLPMPRTAQADGLKDWFLTPDQQGWRSYKDKDFTAASELFTDTDWHAYSLLISGQYELAAEAYARIGTADGANAEGIALLKNRKYRDGVRAFEKALERDPTNEVAAENLEIAKAIVAYVESTQEQSAVGDNGERPDDTVFDNESGLGEETEIAAGEEDAASQTDEQWMRSVDTDVSEFLGTKFALEAAEVSQ